ncbi:MAG: thioredoxin family protein [Proteobacteria bacterium]|nr:thioredoxin family protein [Pseudomonadota bacterium]
MATKRRIEVFSAGCPLCEEVVSRVREAACPSCEIVILSMDEPRVAERAAALGVGAIPAVAIDGELAACCDARGPDMAALRKAGLSRAMA